MVTCWFLFSWVEVTKRCRLKLHAILTNIAILSDIVHKVIPTVLETSSGSWFPLRKPFESIPGENNIIQLFLTHFQNVHSLAAYALVAIAVAASKRENYCMAVAAESTPALLQQPPRPMHATLSAECPRLCVFRIMGQGSHQRFVHKYLRLGLPDVQLSKKFAAASMLIVGIIR